MEEQPQAGSYDGDYTWVSLTKASVDAGVSKSTLRKWVHAGKLPHRVIEGPSGIAWEVPFELAKAKADARPRPASAEVGLPVLAASLANAHALFHGLAEDLKTSNYKAGEASARADALAVEVERLRGVDTARLEAEKRVAVAEAAAQRLREADAARIEAEQRAALAEEEAARLRDEVAKLTTPVPAVVEAPRRKWWGGRAKTG